LQNVESARTRLQNLMPITITLPLEAAKLKKDYSKNELHDTLSLIRRESEHAYPTITVKVSRGPNLQRPGNEENGYRNRTSSGPNPKIKFFLTITGAVGDSENIIQCVTKLRNHFYKQSEVEKQGDVMQCRSTTYYFSGKVENVIKCFRVFQETLPVSLKFNVEESELIAKVRETAPKSEGELLNHFDSSWNLHVAMKKSVLGGEQIYEHDVKRFTGIITTTQANITRMYTYRRAIMSAPFKGPKVVAHDFLKFTGGQALKQFISMNTKYGFMYSMKPDIAGPPVYSVCTLPQMKELS
uniref:KH_10 domain-containing protein n=1 Tax=Steinernema glaseri TaxID=37863 RepID=A0A1I8AV96_9BILA